MVGRAVSQPDSGPVPTPERLLVLTDRAQLVVTAYQSGLVHH